jgi:hypothetical protein
VCQRGGGGALGRTAASDSQLSAAGAPRAGAATSLPWRPQPAGRRTQPTRGRVVPAQPRMTVPRSLPIRPVPHEDEGWSSTATGIRSVDRGAWQCVFAGTMRDYNRSRPLVGALGTPWLSRDCPASGRSSMSAVVRRWEDDETGVPSARAKRTIVERRDSLRARSRSEISVRCRSQAHQELSVRAQPACVEYAGSERSVAWTPRSLGRPRSPGGATRPSDAARSMAARPKEDRVGRATQVPEVHRPAEARDRAGRYARRALRAGRLPRARDRRDPLLRLARQAPRGRQGRARRQGGTPG